MNIAASASPLPSSIRPDAAQDPTRMTLGPDSDCVDPVGIPDDGLQDFGRMLSQSIAKDGVARGTARKDAADGPVDPRVDAAALALTDPAVATPVKASDASDAGAPTTAPDSPIADDLAAQIALVSQWAAVATQPAVAPSAPASGRVVPSLDGTDVKSKLDTVRGAAGAATAAFSKDASGADAVIPDAASKATDALAAASTAADTQPTIATFAMAGATQALERSMRAAANPAGGTSKADRQDTEVAGGATAVPGSARAAATASIERLIALAASVPNAAGTTSANEQAGAADAFASQLATQVSGAASAAAAATTAASNAVPAAATNATTTTITLHEQVGTAAWSHEVGHAALRMAANDLQNVSLHLNPEHLGPMEVQMRIDQGVAHLQFTAAHADTRQALESSRTTLDQMFASQGLKLGDCSVGQQSSNASFARDFGSASRGGPQGGNGNAGAADDGVVTAAVTTRTTRAVGLVDTFA